MILSLITLCLIILHINAQGGGIYDGTIDSIYKISALEGNLGANLTNGISFGVGVAGLTDLNGDGVADIIVGRANEHLGGNKRGAVYILFMNDNGTVSSYTIIGHNTGGFGALSDGDKFGRSVANLGDLDGDDVEDIIVGAPNDGDGGNEAGAVYILFLNQNGSVKSYQKISDLQGNFNGFIAENDHMGWSVSVLPDVNGDGIQDIVCGAPQTNDGGVYKGAIWIMFLNRDGTVNGYQKISDNFGDFTDVLIQNGLFGYSVAVLPDMDGDLIPEIAVGAFSDNTGGSYSGAVYILFLSPTSTVKYYTKIASNTSGLSELGGYFFGGSVAAFPNYDGNDNVAIAVGAESYDNIYNNEGVIYLLLLNNDGTVTTETLIGSESTPSVPLSQNDYFGIGIANFFYNGKYHILTGATGDSDGGISIGAIYILSMNYICDDFYFGSECSPCGCVEGQSTCADTLSGDGTCTCLDLFDGDECELCKDDTKYGLDCDLNCPNCVNGYCDNHPDGSGNCICPDGWDGSLCDQLVLESETELFYSESSDSEPFIETTLPEEELFTSEEEEQSETHSPSWILTIPLFLMSITLY